MVTACRISRSTLSAHLSSSYDDERAMKTRHCYTAPHRTSITLLLARLDFTCLFGKSRISMGHRPLKPDSSSKMGEKVEKKKHEQQLQKATRETLASRKSGTNCSAQVRKINLYATILYLQIWKVENTSTRTERLLDFHRNFNLREHHVFVSFMYPL